MPYCLFQWPLLPRLSYGWFFRFMTVLDNFETHSLLWHPTIVPSFGAMVEDSEVIETPSFRR